MAQEEQPSRERRQNRRRALWYSLFKRRRRNYHKNNYVDLHEPKLFYIVLAVLLLCAIDAYITMVILQHGGKEMNPLMDALIRRDIAQFFYVKFFVTATCVLFFLIHKNFMFFKRFTGYHFLFGSLFIYVLLFIWEIYLLSEIPGLFS